MSRARDWRRKKRRHNPKQYAKLAAIMRSTRGFRKSLERASAALGRLATAENLASHSLKKFNKEVENGPLSEVSG